MGLSEMYRELPQELAQAPLSEVVHLTTLVESLRKNKIREMVTTMVTEFAQEAGISTDVLISDHLWANQAFAEEMFKDLLIEGVTYQEIKSHLVLSEAAKLPEFTF